MTSGLNDVLRPDTADVPLDRDLFLRTLLGHLFEALQDVVGIEEASGFVSIVGQKMGDEIDAWYRRALAVEQLDREQLAEVLVDLKRRIQGDFFVIEQTEDRIVLGNRACPFGEKIEGRPALCVMTSNMFGRIAAQNLGYARVVVEEAIARGDAGCRIVLHLKPAPGGDPLTGQQYFKS